MVMGYASPPDWMTPDEKEGIVLRFIMQPPLMYTIEYVCDILSHPSEEVMTPTNALEELVDQMTGIFYPPQETDDEKKQREECEYFYNHFFLFLSKTGCFEKMIRIINEDINSSCQTETRSCNTIVTFVNNVLNKKLTSDTKLFNFFSDMVLEKPEYPIPKNPLIKLSWNAFRKCPRHFVENTIIERMGNLLKSLEEMIKIPEDKNLLFRLKKPSALLYLIEKAIEKHSLMHMILVLFVEKKNDMAKRLLNMVYVIIGKEKFGKALVCPQPYLSRTVSPMMILEDLDPRIFKDLIVKFLPLIYDEKKDITLSDGYVKIHLSNLVKSMGLDIKGVLFADSVFSNTKIPRGDEKVSSFDTKERCGKMEVLSSSSSVRGKSQKRNMGKDSSSNVKEPNPKRQK